MNEVSYALRRERSPGFRWIPISLLLLLAWLGVVPTQAPAQVLSNLAALVHHLPAGNLAGNEGPKAITSADLDGDGNTDLAMANTDGSVVIHFATGQGRFRQPALILNTGLQANKTLRDIVAADFNADGRPDLAVAAPFQTNVHLFFNTSAPGAPSFQAATSLAAWRGARNLATGDFDGDGRADLVVAGPNHGLRQYRSLGNGSFQVVTNISEVNTNATDEYRFPKPVYSLEVSRPPGATRDHLVMTHADTTLIWLLAPGPDGALQITGTLTNRTPAHALEMGRVFHAEAESNAPPDLISVQLDEGLIQIYRGGTNGSGGFRFEGTSVVHRIPGGPREIELADIDGNGWNDLAVVARYLDSVFTYANTNGVLQLFSGRQVGSSPRDLVTAQLNPAQDAFPDLAVINRDSADVTILLAYPQQAGYRGVSHVYPADGNVAGLKVQDFNGDGRADVIQLHSLTGDFSVRLAGTNGTLDEPTFFSVGNVPSAQVFEDINHDGVRDHITTHLGTREIEQGYVTVRKGLIDAMGRLTFGPEETNRLPAGVDGRLFALVPGDFNRDGHIDLVAGFLDSRVAFFQGDGTGAFTHTRTHRFVDQARGLEASDFDQDGDLDLAGIGISGEVWVVENPGNPAGLETNLLSVTSLTNLTQIYPPPPGESFGGRRILVIDHNGDGDPDLVTGSGKGAWLYLGGAGMSFVAQSTPLAGTTHFVSDLVFADVDQDGNKDLVVACQGIECLSVFTPNGAGGFRLLLPADAPASRYLAVGDVDGDGKPDLVGSGRVLWVALSGHAPIETAPRLPISTRPTLTNVVINEILAINTALPVSQDGNRLVDWVELYNGGTTPLSLNGWSLIAIGPDEKGVIRTNAYAFPMTAFLDRAKHLLIFFSEERRTLYHNTNYALSSDTNLLLLLNPSGVVVDQVPYPSQRPNLSYARFQDGHRSFVFNPFPSPGQTNVFNGLPEPNVKFTGVEPDSFKPGSAIRIHAEVAADFVVSSVTAYAHRLDQPNSRAQTNRLRDDGLNGDPSVSDGLYVGELDPQPAGAEVELYLVVIGMHGETTLHPDEPEFGLPGSPGNAFQLALPTARPSLEISEINAANRTSLIVGTNSPDYVEVRNTGLVPLALGGFSLSQQIGENARYQFPPGTVLPPGGHFLVFCDNDPERGPQHAPFRLRQEGELLMLTGLTTNNSRTLVDWVSYPTQNVDQAFARLGAGGDWWKTTPTPGTGNVATAWIAFRQATDTGEVFTLAFPTTTNALYTVQTAPTLAPGGAWTNQLTLTGDGIEKVIRLPLTPAGFVRVRRDPMQMP